MRRSRGDADGMRVVPGDRRSFSLLFPLPYKSTLLTKHVLESQRAVRTAKVLPGREAGWGKGLGRGHQVCWVHTV